ncbi:MAG: four helix bundle protein [Verrucomicrobiales bacterium]|nr:four helix bundle protein [Verrucomicrobiales bacterium]
MAWKSFTEIEAWQLARKQNRLFWDEFGANGFGRDYALFDQLNRSLGSIMDNIAEGFDGGSDKEFAKFLSYSQRSCSEAKSQLYRAEDRQHLDPDLALEWRSHLDEIHRIIGGIIRHLRS